MMELELCAGFGASGAPARGGKRVGRAYLPDDAPGPIR